jgi:hypothetical protein
MRSKLLSLALGLAVVGALALAPSEARAHWWSRPVVVVNYPPPAYYPPPAVYVAPAYPAYPAPVVTAAYYSPAYPTPYVAPAYYGGYVGWPGGFVRWGKFYP